MVATDRHAVLAAVVAACVLVVAVAAGTGDDAGWFLHLGETGPALERARELLGGDIDVPHRIGHDGASFWALARDPLLTDPAATSALLDRPAYRARRIGYPLLASPWRLGGEQALLWGLVLTNIAAVGVGGWALARLRGADRTSPPLALGLATLSPAVLVALLFDLADAVALAALFLAAVFAERRPGVVLVLASATVGLTRESYAIGLAGLAALAPGLDRRTRVLVIAPAVVAAAAWTAYVQARLGDDGGGIRELTLVPFDGWVDAWQRTWSPADDWGSALASVLLLVAGATVVALLVRRRTPLLAMAAPFALSLPFLTIHVIELPHNLVRATGPMIAALILEATSRPAPIGPARPPNLATGS